MKFLALILWPLMCLLLGVAAAESDVTKAYNNNTTVNMWFFDDINFEKETNKEKHVTN